MDSYRERLLVPVSYWLLAVPVVLTLGGEAYFFVDGFIPLLVMGVLACAITGMALTSRRNHARVVGGRD